MCSAAQNITITKGMLIGDGVLGDTGSQLAFDVQVYDQVGIAGMRAWRELPSRGETSPDLTSIHQSPHEPLQDFAACLLQASEKVINDKEVSKLIVQ